MHQDIKELAQRNLVSGRLKMLGERENGVQKPRQPAAEYANIPQPSEYANIPQRPESLAFEQSDRRNPAGPKQQGSIDLHNGWSGRGTFVANPPTGLIFKMQGREINDGLVKFTPEQTKTLLDNDRHGLIKASMQEGTTTEIGYRKDGAVNDWQVRQPRPNVPQQRGPHK